MVSKGHLLTLQISPHINIEASVSNLINHVRESVCLIFFLFYWVLFLTLFVNVSCNDCIYKHFQSGQNLFKFCIFEHEEEPPFGVGFFRHDNRIALSTL